MQRASLMQSQDLSNMRNAWEKTAKARYTTLENVADAVRFTTAAVDTVATQVDTFDGRLANHEHNLTNIGNRIDDLENRAAANLAANTKSPAQKAAAWGVVLTGISGILAMPAAVHTVSQNCPTDSDHSAVACRLGIAALTGATLGVVTALLGLAALCFRNGPAAGSDLGRRRNQGAQLQLTQGRVSERLHNQPDV